jgi:hypothetical protein
MDRAEPDAAGEVTEWGVDVRGPNAVSTNMIRTCNVGSTISPTGSPADADDCGAIDPMIDRGKQAA